MADFNRARFEFFVRKLRDAREEMHKIVVGQEEMIDCLLIALILNGHVWNEGPPGVGKTLGAFTLAAILDIDFKKTQFTPDMLPSDLKVTIDPLAHTKKGESVELLDRFEKGVVFTNLLLIDEGNRAPQKVQSALLEVTQERQVTIGNQVYTLELPHMVIITTNSVEHEGTYTLAEALTDRITLKARLSYPSFEEECKIAARRKEIEAQKISLRKVFTRQEILEMQGLFSQVFEFDPYLPITSYAVRIVRTIRSFDEYVAYGPTPRGSSDLLTSAAALAFCRGETELTAGFIQEMAMPALRGTFTLTDKADRESLDHDALIRKALDKTPIFAEEEK